MKFIKPASVYLVCICVAFIIVARILIHRFSNKIKPTTKTLPLDELNDLQIGLSNNLLRPDFHGGPDPFINGDFLDKKFLQLVSLTHLASNMALTSKNETFPLGTDFSFLLNELMIVINVKNFYSRLLGCKEIAAIQVQEGLPETLSKVLHPGFYREKQVMIETAKPNVDVLVSANCGAADSDNSPANLDRCFLLKNRVLLDEAALLMQLSHRSIARMLGLCLQHGNSKQPMDQKLSSAGVVLIRETGTTANIEKLKMMDWNDRIKICLDLLNLAVYFSKSPLGSIRLEEWAPANFILNSESKKIQLNNFDRFLSLTEPQCQADKDCFVDSINCGLKCVAERCIGYNAKSNLHSLNHIFLSPLLRYNTHPGVSENIVSLLLSMNNLKSSALELFISLQELAPQVEAVENKASLPEKKAAKVDNPAVLSMQKLPDGSQVDSSEQHENKFAINDVNPVLVKKVEPAPVNPADDEPVELQEYADPNGFRKIENADFPGRYDYYCPGSKAEWGCVMSLKSLDEAMERCLHDDKCKAFVSIPHLRKEGWFIVILKSDNSNAVDHAGTTVFIRQHSSGAPVSHQLPPDDAAEDSRQDDCLNDVIKEQTKVRQSLEASLMKACGWGGMTDDDWATGVKEGKIKDASSFKPARGKLANGGQMDVVVEIDSKEYPAVFVAKKGPEEFDVCQSTVHQIDRLLGFYKTVPAIERLLSVDELSEAGFPTDIGGNQFDKFRSLKQSDGSLLGVIIPKVPERVSIEHYISVPRLSGLTNAVTPFNAKQWDGMEYLMLGYLASLPFSPKGHQAVKGRLLHLKNEEAFLRRTNDYVSYFYNCQFPAHVIAVLRHAETQRCDLGSAIRTRLFDESSPQIAQVLRDNLKKLLDIVDQCVTRFGKQVVLYDADLSVKRR